jgi:hypothetical protein
VTIRKVHAKESIFFIYWYRRLYKINWLLILKKLFIKFKIYFILSLSCFISYLITIISCTWNELIEFLLCIIVLFENGSSPVWFPREGVNFSSQPLITFFIIELLCNKKKHVARIRLEELLTGDNLFSYYLDKFYFTLVIFSCSFTHFIIYWWRGFPTCQFIFFDNYF